MAERKIFLMTAGIAAFAVYGVASIVVSILAELPTAVRMSGSLALGIALLAAIFRRREQKEN